MPGQQSPDDRCCGEPVAQLVEHVTFNHGVVGSNPAGLTSKIKDFLHFKAPQKTVGEPLGSLGRQSGAGLEAHHAG